MQERVTIQLDGQQLRLLAVRAQQLAEAPLPAAHDPNCYVHLLSGELFRKFARRLADGPPQRGKRSFRLRSYEALALTHLCQAMKTYAATESWEHCTAHLLSETLYKKLYQL